jgi:hypothetical protein
VAVGLFARARIMPGVMRWVLGGLAVYAAVAFIQGALLIVPYDQLLRGHSLLTWLPRWLQGAFLGGLIALPAAMVLALVRDLSPPRRPVRAALHTGAWGLLVALAFGGLRAPAGPVIFEALADEKGIVDEARRGDNRCSDRAALLPLSRRAT